MSQVLSISNVTYIDDIEYTIQLNRWFLKPIGVWPISTNDSRNEKIKARALHIVCYFLIAIIFIPCIMYIAYEEKDLQKRLAVIGPLSHWIIGGINYFSLLSKSNDIRKCIENVEENLRNIARTKDREVMLESAKIGRTIACFSAICMQFGTLSYVIITGISKVDMVINNKTVSTHPVMCPICNKLFDNRLSPINEIFVITQIVSCFVTTSITVGACGLAAVLAMHACGQLNILMLWLDEFVTKDKGGQIFLQHKLSTIVHQHLRALRLISRMENIMHPICLVELVGCTLNLCMLGYYCLTEWNNGALLHMMIFVIILVSMAFNIFIFCYIGEILMQKCKEVGQRAYMIKWYYLPRETALSLILIISRSNAVIKITAGKMIKLSIVTFGDVIKTSVAYLNILRTVST